MTAPAGIREVTTILDGLIGGNDVIEESATRLVFELDGHPWEATYACGLISVESGDVSADLAFDGDDWKPVAKRLVQGLYWAGWVG